MTTSQGAGHSRVGRRGARGGRGPEAPLGPAAWAGAPTGLRKGAWGAESVRARRALRQRHLILAAPEAGLVRRGAPPARHPGARGHRPRGLPEPVVRAPPPGVPPHCPRGVRPPLAPPRPPAPTGAHRLGSAPGAAATRGPGRGGAGARGRGEERRPVKAAVSRSRGGHGERRLRGSPAGKRDRPDRGLEERAWGPAHSRFAPAVQQLLARSLARSGLTGSRK